jgi:uncharacterized protein
VGKLILLALGIAFAWWVLKKYRKSVAQDAAPRVQAPEDMVRCAHCGIHLPRSESHASGGEFFCSEDHLRVSH